MRFPLVFKLKSKSCNDFVLKAPQALVRDYTFKRIHKLEARAVMRAFVIGNSSLCLPLITPKTVQLQFYFPKEWLIDYDHQYHWMKGDLYLRLHLTLLNIASMYGHYELVLKILEMGVDVNQRTGQVWTSLNWAMAGRHLNVVRLLASRGARIAKVKSPVTKPMELAARLGHVDVMQALYESGQDPTALAIDNCLASKQMNALRWVLEHTDSVDEKLFKTIVWTCSDAAGMNNVVYLLKKMENPPLHYLEDALTAAASHNNEKLCKMLLEAGASAHGVPNSDKTPLSCSAALGSLKVCTLLLHQDPTLLNTFREGSDTLLHVAAANGFHLLCKLFISQGISVDIRDERSQTPLMHAAKRGHLETCKFLIQIGASLNTQDIQGLNTLMYAGYSENKNLARWLKQNGAEFPPVTQTLSAFYTKRDTCSIIEWFERHIHTINRHKKR
ncbi:ankyrin repeat-containing domain protein [Gorgonomyces haynaldii]|nr:ankyrin repeat-containing domain protein [Gorgonomyces haynaldii]